MPSKSALRRLHSAVFIAGFSVVTLITFVFFFSWTGVIICLAVWFLANCPGVGIGFHRLLTHRGFQTPKIVEYTLSILGCLALQGSPTHWVAVHRKHHKYTDQPGLDPHTPQEGVWWAHIFWMLLPNSGLDEDLSIREKYAPDLAKDKVHQIIHRFWWIPTILLATVLFVIGLNISLHTAIGFVLWGTVVHVAIGWQITWLVNSWTHKWGSRRFDTPDDSTNSGWVALFTFGEGWHNNHHAHPTSARHGLSWHNYDMNYYLIKLMELVGLAKNVKTPKFD